MASNGKIRSKHLTGINSFFDVMPTTGTIRLERVSKLLDARFPLHYRLAYQSGGTMAVIKALQEDKGLSLASSWSELKRMINGA